MKNVIIISAVAARALNASIEKWKQCASATRIAAGVSDCPLCGEYYYSGCGGCPISTDVNNDCCRSTPYHAYERKKLELYGSDQQLMNLLQPEAKAEYKYLKNLQKRCFVRVKGERVCAKDIDR